MTVGNPGCVRKAAPPTLYAPSPSPPLPSSPAVSCMLGGSRLSPSPRAVASEDGDAVSAFCRCGETRATATSHQHDARMTGGTTCRQQAEHVLICKRTRNISSRQKIAPHTLQPH